jgi:trimethylamine:corrinoid methyltransferase-like protein
VRYHYPEYDADWTPDLMATCRDTGQRLLEDVGLRVAHDGFVAAIRGHAGVTVRGDRVHLSRRLTDEHFDAFIARNRERLLSQAPAGEREWSISCDGFSIAVVDIATDEAREATCQDLRDLIRLVHSLGMGGSYPCCPQDVPPLMRALATFRICWEESDRIRPFDYLDARQTPFLYEMHRVMDQPFVVNVNIPHCMTVSPHDLDVFMRWYPVWKEHREQVAWYNISDYSMVGINRPLSATGSVAAYLAQSFGAHVLFQLFDPEILMAPRLLAGMPVDLRTMGWAWGSPRLHLYQFLNDRALPALCGLHPDEYRASQAFMCTSSCAVDARSGMEKMASSLTAALQGARTFGGAGNLAVDDLFSGVQLLLDVEIFEYIRELAGSFSPQSDLMDTAGLYDLIREVAEGEAEFYAHPDTAGKVRHLMPVSKRRPAEKLRSWMLHHHNLKDRLREEALERIAGEPAFALDPAKRQELTRIYAAAERELVG